MRTNSCTWPHANSQKKVKFVLILVYSRLITLRLPVCRLSRFHPVDLPGVRPITELTEMGTARNSTETLDVFPNFPRK